MGGDTATCRPKRALECQMLHAPRSGVTLREKGPEPRAVSSPPTLILSPAEAGSRVHRRTTRRRYCGAWGDSRSRWYRAGTTWFVPPAPAMLAPRGWLPGSAPVSAPTLRFHHEPVESEVGLDRCMDTGRAESRGGLFVAGNILSDREARLPQRERLNRSPP